MVNLPTLQRVELFFLDIHTHLTLLTKYILEHTHKRETRYYFVSVAVVVAGGYRIIWSMERKLADNKNGSRPSFSFPPVLY